MSAKENKNEKEDEKKDEERQTPVQTGLKTTTETSTVFFLSKFGSKDDSCTGITLPKNFKEFDSLLRKILINLEETENVFLNQAKAVLDRDLALITWKFRLKSLEKMLQEKKQDFERIDQTVQCIFRMSSHIDNILKKLEKEVPGPSLFQNAFKYSPERMKMYDSMIKINIGQRDILSNLSNAVSFLNDAVECDPSDPVEQLTRILSLHVEILRTIEMRTGLLQEQLTTIRTLLKYYHNSKKPMSCDYFWFNA